MNRQTILKLITNVTQNMNKYGYLDQTDELKKLKNFDKFVELLDGAELTSATKMWYDLVINKIFLGLSCDSLLSIANNEEALKWLSDVVELDNILHNV